MMRRKLALPALALAAAGCGANSEEVEQVGVVTQAVTGGESSTLALKGSTEEAQFEAAPAR